MSITVKRLMTMVAVAGCAGAVAISAAAQQAAPQRPNYPVEAEGTMCPRAELKAMVDAYSAALAAHDPKRAPLAANVRFTENAELLSPGKSSLWKGAGAWDLRNDLIDTERCGTVSWGVIEQDGSLIHAAIRLQTNADGAISEAEHITAGAGGFFPNPEAVIATATHLDWETILAPQERSSRAAMTAAANDYFTMFDETHNVNVPFADRCDRWENGIRPTRTHICTPPARGSNNHPPRRIPLVDLEAGIVAAFVHFRNSLVDVHILKMQRGKVGYMMAVVGPETKDGGWPLDDAKR